MEVVVAHRQDGKLDEVNPRLIDNLIFRSQAEVNKCKHVHMPYLRLVRADFRHSATQRSASSFVSH